MYSTNQTIWYSQHRTNRPIEAEKKVANPYSWICLACYLTSIGTTVTGHQILDWG
jgi:galactose-1-phosphate uridylyltransferase